MSVLLASGGRDGRVCVWDLESRSCRSTLTGHTAAVSGVTFLSDGSSVGSCSLDGVVRVFDLGSGGRLVRSLDEHEGAATSLVQLDHSLLASAGSDASVRVWDVRAGGGGNVLTLFAHDAAVYGLCSIREQDGSSSSSPTLASASWDRTVKHWNLRMASDSEEASLRCARTLVGHMDAVRCVTQVGPHHLASGGWDRTVRTWDLNAADDADACIGVVKSHTAWVYTLGYLASRQLVVSGSGDRTVRLSSPGASAAESVLAGHENTIWAVAPLPSSPSSTGVIDECRFASGGADGQVRVWDLKRQECFRIDGGHLPGSSIYCLDSWSAAPPAPFRPITAAPNEQDESEKSRVDTVADANADSSNALPYSSAPLSLASHLDHASHRKWAAAITARSSHIVFTNAPAIFASASAYAAIDARAVPLEDANSSPSSALEQDTPSDASAAPTALSSTTTVVHPLVRLAALQPVCVQQLNSGLWAAAESSLLEMLAVVEAEHESTTSSSSSPSPSRLLDLPSMLFYLFHDLALVAGRQQAFARAGSYLRSCLAWFAEDDEEEDQNDADATITPIARRAEHIERALFALLSENVADEDVFFPTVISSAVRRSKPAASRTTLPTRRQAAKVTTSSSQTAKHNEFRSAMLQAKKAAAMQKKAEGVSASPPRPESASADLVSCPHCQRKFSQVVATRHIPACASAINTMNTVAPPPPAAEAAAGPAEDGSSAESSSTDSSSRSDTSSAFALHHLTLPPPSTTSSSPATSPTAVASSASRSRLLVASHLRRGALHAPLLLRRFWCAAAAHDLPLALASSTALLALAEDVTPAARQRVLDEVTRAVTSGLSQGAIDRRLRSTAFARALTRLHREVLPTKMRALMREVRAEKRRGNEAFAVAGATASPTATSATAAAASSESSTESPSYAHALALYESALDACAALDRLLNACPIRAWAELVASGAAPSAPWPSSSPVTGSSSSPSDAGDAEADDATWCTASLDLAHAQLHANASMMALKCADHIRASASTTEKELEEQESATLVASSRSHAERGIAVVERLQGMLRLLTDADAAQSKVATVVEVDENETATAASFDSVHLALDHPLLRRAMPTTRELAALLSKLYFRHGLACFESAADRDVAGAAACDALAEQSWQLALHLQPDEKVRREIEARRARRAREATRTALRTPIVTPPAPRLVGIELNPGPAGDDSASTSNEEEEKESAQDEPQQISHPPARLTNVDNSCYFNVLVQMAASAPTAFREVEGWDVTQVTDPKRKKDADFVLKFQRLMKSMHDTTLIPRKQR